MKIMFYTWGMGKGGAERVISVLSNNFTQDNQVSIVINEKKNCMYKLASTVTIIELDNKKYKNKILKNIHRINETKKILNEEKPDIIISFLPVPSFRVLYANKKTKIPIIVSDRNNPEREYKSLIFKALMKILYKKADGFVFQTQLQKEYFSKEIQKKSIIIGNPIKNEFLEKTEIKKENIIINIGRLVEQKNQKLLIDSFSKVSDELKNYKLKIFGEGPLRKSLERQIKNLGMENKIQLCGVSDNIKTELAKSKLFVLSSNYEGMPNALIEAMAIGLPVISTDCPCGGPKELINNKENGVLIPVGNEEKMSEAIKNILNDIKYAEQLGKNARNIVDKLNQEKIAQEWKIYINKIIKEKK